MHRVITCACVNSASRNTQTARQYTHFLVCVIKNCSHVSAKCFGIRCVYWDKCARKRFRDKEIWFIILCNWVRWWQELHFVRFPVKPSAIWWRGRASFADLLFHATSLVFFFVRLRIYRALPEPVYYSPHHVIFVEDILMKLKLICV